MKLYPRIGLFIAAALLAGACGSGGALPATADGGSRLADDGGAPDDPRDGGVSDPLDGGSPDVRDGGATVPGADGGAHHDGGFAHDAGVARDGGSIGADGGGGDDGAATRAACTSRFGSALSTSFGRLDGFLVSIVPTGQHGCNEDPDHLHLQISMGGAVYDIAITIRSQTQGDSVMLHELDAPLGGGAWQEGWHTGERLDYPTTLGVHASDFTAMTPTALSAAVSAALASVNHISVFATAYGPTGAHLVHRNGHEADGALVIHPTTGSPHYFLFHFGNQSF